MWLFSLGILVHVIFFTSVFDIYFRTPLIHGMTPQVYDGNPAAKRLVLFVADGLRADTFFELVNETTRAPFLRGIIETTGTFGVSHTRVPTESRPGHVAIVAGIYEDPSAIAKGWKENPVEFDTVFNQSRLTWSWGSPDILNMFSSRSSRGNVKAFTYSASHEDFASKDASFLDTWVFDKVENFFKDAASNKDLLSLLHQDRIIFFLHLLGLDTNGHSHKPHSQEYQRNLEIVDDGVRRISALINNFYKDNSSTFLVTSDHGMTDWGSHGSGDPSETETPIIAWGSGITTPQDSSNFQERILFDPRVEKWGLSHLRKVDIYQTDIAPFMAGLLSIPIPMNSIGTLPVEYLDTSDEYKAGVLYANARQILAQFEQKQAQKAQNTLPALYKPFYNLLPDQIVQFHSKIRNALKDSNYDVAIQLCYDLISLSLAGISYYHNYDRTSLSLSITLGFIAWILLLVCQLLKDHTTVGKIVGGSYLETRRLKRKSIFLASLILLWGFVALVLLIFQRSPWQHYLYYLMPVILWGIVYSQIESLQYAWLVLKSLNMVWELAIRILVTIVGLEILVFSFFLRPLLSIGLIGIGLWPVVLHTVEGKSEKSLQVCWLGSCILLASFTYLPVVGKEAIYGLVEIAGLLAFVLLGIGLFWCGGESWMLRTIPLVVYIQGGVLLSSIYLVHSTAFSIQIKEGLPLGNQLASWILLGLSFILPILGSSYIMGRLVSITAALLCPFVLLSIRHEVFFYIALSVAMFVWLFLEYYFTGANVQIAALKFAVWDDSTSPKSARFIDWSDLRRAFFFLFFVVLSFFGIGNIASVNSFDPSFVYCFVTVFSPFVMGGLLLLKIVVPFLLVTCFFQAICSLLEVPVRALFLMFLILSDMMALHFFFLIKTEGSWLDIGTSISHYVICMATTVFLMALMQVAKLLTIFSLSFSVVRAPEEEVLPRVNRRRPHKD